jgi:catechol 2,3-dioxygenase-like lactoylglutathione lyase family enzyme
MSQEASDLFTRLAPVLNVRDLPAERAFYERLGLPVIYEGPEYPEFIGFGTESVHFGIRTPSGYRLALEGPNE